MTFLLRKMTGSGSVAWDELKLAACWLVDQLGEKLSTVVQLTDAILSM